MTMSPYDSHTSHPPVHNFLEPVNEGPCNGTVFTEPGNTFGTPGGAVQAQRASMDACLVAATTTEQEATDLSLVLEAKRLLISPIIDTNQLSQQDETTSNALVEPS